MAANPKFMNEKAVKFKLNGNEVEAYGDETILQAAKRITSYLKKLLAPLGVLKSHLTNISQQLG